MVAVRAELATENWLPDVFLDLKHHRTALRFTSELENIPGVRFGANGDMQFCRRTFVTGTISSSGPTEIHPSVLVHRRSGLSPTHVNAQPNRAEQLPARDAAGPAHPADKDGDLENNDRLGGEPTECGGIQMEAGSGSRGLGRRRG